MSKTKKRKRRSKGPKKGPKFEREFCVQLSEWWSRKKREDLFWRTSGSGSRATTRGKRGKTTVGHCGDVCSTDPQSKPMMDVVSIELKKGYAKNNLLDLLDKSKRAAQQTWESWIEKAVRGMENSDAFAWLLITKRDYREPLVFMPDYLEAHLQRHGASFPGNPYFRLRTTIRFSTGRRTMTIVVMNWDKWLKAVHPDIIRELSKEV